MASMRPQSKITQISFKVEDELAARIKAAAEHEELPVADLVRKIFKTGFEQFESLGSLYALRAAEAAASLAKSQTTLERSAYRKQQLKKGKKLKVFKKSHCRLVVA